MKNKKQITLLVSVPITITYDIDCGLEEEHISNEVKQQVGATLMDNLSLFPDQKEFAILNEFSVLVNDIMPTNYKYD